MKRYALPFVLILALSGAACSPPVTVQTTAGKAAFTADQVVLRVNELQAAAIQANANGALPTATTRLIVEFAVGADKTLKEAPNGWQATVSKAWAETKGKLPPITNPAISAAVQSFELALASFGG